MCTFSRDLIVNLFPSAHLPLIGFFVFMSMCSPAETLYYWFWLNYLQSFKTDLLDKSRIQCVGNLSQLKEILHLGAPIVKYELKSFSCVLSYTLLRFLVIKLLLTHLPSGNHLLSSQSWRKVRKRKMEYEANI